MNMDLRSLGGGAVFLGDHLANVVCWHEGLEKDEFIEVCERHFGIATHGEGGEGGIQHTLTSLVSLSA